jgi:catechol 2,3-dioxygenase-like lactoylglutathione lyase family enzyme
MGDPKTTPRIDMKLEVAVIPVSDVDRAKRFYADLGWRLDADFARADGSRAVQLTPPGSPASIQLGTTPFLYLLVSDIKAARAELLARGVDVSEVFHRGPRGRLGGPDPERPSYGSLATFGVNHALVPDEIWPSEVNSPTEETPWQRVPATGISPHFW